MKLAEALQERADLNRRIEQLRMRMNKNALVQEGEAPLESPEELLRELDGSIARLQFLISRINLTNGMTKVNGRSLTELIAEKDVLAVKLSVYRDFAASASHTIDRVRGSEIRIQPTVSVAALQKQIDTMAKTLRQIDNQLQETNWTTELIEA